MQFFSNDNTYSSFIGEFVNDKVYWEIRPDMEPEGEHYEMSADIAMELYDQLGKVLKPYLDKRSDDKCKAMMAEFTEKLDAMSDEEFEQSWRDVGGSCMTRHRVVGGWMVEAEGKWVLDYTEDGAIEKLRELLGWDD